MAEFSARAKASSGREQAQTVLSGFRREIVAWRKTEKVDPACWQLLIIAEQQLIDADNRLRTNGNDLIMLSSVEMIECMLHGVSLAVLQAGLRKVESPS